MLCFLKRSAVICIEFFSVPILLLFSAGCRFRVKKIDIGMGPVPLINNIYHKKALIEYGYSCETFVSDVYFITKEFDVNASDYFRYQLLRNLYLYFHSCIRYRCIYLYFRGGALGSTNILWMIEPFLYRIAGIKTVVMPYGGDVHDLMCSKDLLFKQAIMTDYPKLYRNRNLIRKKVNLWSQWADHVISGCDWVDYMYRWDTLLLAHFSIDLKKFDHLLITQRHQHTKKFRILHAPNHREIKGTKYFIQAVEELQKEGYEIELILLEKRSNDEILKAINEADLIADQLIIGWYAMFAIEAMALKKPVFCYLRQDLIDLFYFANLIKENEIPIIQCSIYNVKEKIIHFYKNRGELLEVGERSRQFIEKFHSIKYIGSIFNEINISLEINK